MREDEPQDEGRAASGGSRSGAPEDQPSPAGATSSGRQGQGPGRLPSGLFQRLRRARRALTVVRGYAFVGAILAAGLFAASYLKYETEMPRWICRVGAMGALVGAMVGLNVMDRLVRGRSLPATAVAFALALIAVALLGVGVGSMRYKLGAAWSPLTAATYVVVGVRIILRFRSTPSEEAR
ncbi:MAG: hypothetical protein RBU30_05645 [Polyangia bacterium]|nr:hypothetical protein [Polyangia bacterium]